MGTLGEYKPFWQGGAWVLSIPSIVSKVTGLKKSDVLLLKVEDGKLILTNPPKLDRKIKRIKKIDDKHYLVLVRELGAMTPDNRDKMYVQLGFTIPSEVSDKFANVKLEVTVEILSEKEFKIVYVPKKEN